MSEVSHPCGFCDKTVSGADLRAFGDAFIAHVRADHPDFPYPDPALRNYAEATQRVSAPRPRKDEIGPVEVHPVTAERIDDWLDFFDHDAFAGKCEWAACYCTEPMLATPEAPGEASAMRSWQENRETMVEMLSGGRAYGYLAYCDGRPVGWVNASTRAGYNLFREGADADPPDDSVVGLACFVIAPDYRRHGASRAGCSSG